MHSAACLCRKGLGHQGRRAAILNRLVADNVFRRHGIIGKLEHLAKLHLHFHLAAAAHLVMVVFHIDAPFFHLQADLAAQVIIDIHGKRNVIASLMLDLVTVIVIIVRACPVGLAGMDAVSHFLRSRLVFDFVKQIEFVFRSDDHLIGNALFLHEVKSPDRHVSRILVERTVLRKGDDLNVADH